MNDIVRYFHVDKGHVDYQQIVDDCETEHKTSHPLALLSVNSDRNDVEAMIKVCCTSEEWTAAQPWAASPAVLGVYTDVSVVAAIVGADTWAPDEVVW